MKVKVLSFDYMNNDEWKWINLYVGISLSQMMMSYTSLLRGHGK